MGEGNRGERSRADNREYGSRLMGSHGLVHVLDVLVGLLDVSDQGLQ